MELNMNMLTSMKELPFYYWYIWTINAYIRKKKKEKCREKRKREREANIPQVTWKTNKALTQDLYRSRRHRASSRGGLENPSGKVSLAGFHSAKSWPWRRRRNRNLLGFRHQKCRVRELEKARFRKRTRRALHRNR